MRDLRMAQTLVIQHVTRPPRFRAFSVPTKDAPRKPLTMRDLRMAQTLVIQHVTRAPV